MLKSFEINNFRLFQHLSINKLSHVNLIVGKNNSGKSTFLEALQLYVSNASPNIIVDLLEFRQEAWASEADSQSFFINTIRHLFYGRKLPEPEIEEEGISLGEVSSDIKLHIRSAFSPQLQLPPFNDVSAPELVLTAETQGKTRTLFDLSLTTKATKENLRRMGRFSRQKDGMYPLQIVSTDNLSDRQLASLWDLIALTPLESEVVSALHLIDNRVSRIAFVENINQYNRRIPIVKMKEIEETLPLKTMGDGMNRLLHIIIALVNAKDGILLIDEFENGLHWTVQPKLWDIVFELSNKLNIQVFATTHSRDCVKGFEIAWNKYPNDGSFFRFDVKDEVVKAREYRAETLTNAMDMDVEVR